MQNLVTEPNLFMSMFKSFFILCLVLLFFFLILLFIKKINNYKFNSNDIIKILLVHHISHREKLIIVDIAGKKILIGVTSQSINKICEIEDEDIESLNLKGNGKKNFFDNILLKAIRKKS